MPIRHEDEKEKEKILFETKTSDTCLKNGARALVLVSNKKFFFSFCHVLIWCDVDYQVSSLLFVFLGLYYIVCLIQSPDDDSFAIETSVQINSLLEHRLLVFVSYWHCFYWQYLYLFLACYLFFLKIHWWLFLIHFSSIHATGFITAFWIKKRKTDQ